MDASDREYTVQLPEKTRLLFIDDDYVNFLYFNELLDNSGGEIVRAVSISQAIYKLKFKKGINIIFISAGFAKSFNYTIIRFLKDKFLSIPLITIIDDQSSEAEKKCIEEGSDCYIYRHIDSHHLIESIRDILESSLFIKHSHR
jgi:DNA-binding NarL/FixJ family response regulator